MQTTIRKATAADMPAVLQLIQELADYEKAPEEVIVTVAQLQLDGFTGDRPYFYCFIAENENGVAGIALYYIKYSTWKGRCVFLEDIVVTQRERRKGIGKVLFDAVLEEAKQSGAKRMEWQVLDWNEPAIEFYKQYEPQVLNEWLNYRLVLNS